MNDSTAQAKTQVSAHASNDSCRKEGYAITVNICPNKYMNKKKWKLYSQDNQRAQLERLEVASRKYLNDLECTTINFEVCPVLNNIHFHAYYVCTYEQFISLKSFWDDKIRASDDWRHFDGEKVRDHLAWLNYCRKYDNH